MEKSENKQIFYFQMSCDFFDNDDRIKILEAQTNGFAYCNLYLKLLLKSAKTGGYYRISDALAHDARSISATTGIDIDTVKSGMNILQSLELIEVLDDGTIIVPAAADFAERIKVLADNPHAERQRRYKERKKAEKAALQSQKTGKIESVTESNAAITGSVTKASPEVTQSNEKNDDSYSYSYNYSYSKKEKEKEREKKSPANASETTHTKPKEKSKKISCSAPEFSEVKEFIHARGDLISAERFYNYYMSLGWPLADWRARVLYWEATQKERKATGAIPFPPLGYMEREVTPEELAGLVSDPERDLQEILEGVT